MFSRFLLLLTFLLASGCSTSATVPEGTADASGIVREILAVPTAPNTSARILVEHPGQAVPADRSIVHISSETELLVRTRSGKTRAGEISDLRVGLMASITITDLELRSYPRQVFATRIVVPE